MKSYRDRVAAKTAGLRSASEIGIDEVKAPRMPKTGVGMVALLFDAMARFDVARAKSVSQRLHVYDIVANGVPPPNFGVNSNACNNSELRPRAEVGPIVVRRTQSHGGAYKIVIGESSWGGCFAGGQEMVDVEIIVLSEEDIDVLEQVGAARLESALRRRCKELA